MTESKLNIIVRNVDYFKEHLTDDWCDEPARVLLANCSQLIEEVTRLKAELETRDRLIADALSAGEMEAWRRGRLAGIEEALKVTKGYDITGWMVPKRILALKREDPLTPK